MAEMSIEYPNISEQSPEGQLQQVKDYLFLLADKLNLQDNSAEKIFQEVSKAIDADAVATQDNEQSAKLREYANLKALIVKTGDYALHHSEEFEKVLKASYSASSEMGEFDEELVQTVKENAEGIERLFDYTAGINNEEGRWGVGTKQFVKTGLLYYDEGQVPVFGVGVGVINSIVAKDDQVIDIEQNRLATFTADEIAFWDNGNKVAYISGNAINFPAANIRGGSIHIGEEEHDFFKVDTSGNLQIGDYFSVNSAGLAKFQSADGKFYLDLTAGNINLIEGSGHSQSKIVLGEGMISTFFDNTLTGRITGYVKEELEDGPVYGIDSRAQFQNFDVINVDGQIKGAFNSSGLTTGSVRLLDQIGNKVYGEFYCDWNTLDSVLKVNKFTIGNINGTDMINGGYNGSGGKIEIRDFNGDLVSRWEATSGGTSWAMGNAKDGIWTIAEYDYEGRHVHADHFHFYNKTDGLVTSRKSASQCSAYIVAMKPTSDGGYVSIIIPSDKADGSTLWQIADDAKFCNFTINSSGNISYVNGTNITGSALVYSIR